MSMGGEKSLVYTRRTFRSFDPGLGGPQLLVYQCRRASPTLWPFVRFLSHDQNRFRPHNGGDHRLQS